MTGSMMLKNRSEHHTKIAEYAQSLGERMGAIDRVTSRLAGEQNGNSSYWLYQVFPRFSQT